MKGVSVTQNVAAIILFTIGAVYLFMGLARIGLSEEDWSDGNSQHKASHSIGIGAVLIILGIVVMLFNFRPIITEFIA